MEAIVAELAALGLGVLVGAAVVAGVVVLSRRAGRSSHGADADDRQLGSPGLPPGTVEVLAVLPSAVIVVDETDVVRTASPAAYAYGIVRDGHVVHDRLTAMVDEVRADRRIREAELELRRGPLGREVLVVHARVAPLADRYVLLLVSDNTEARRVEEIRRDFVANVSHELKTPVGAIALLAEAIADNAEDADAVRRFAVRMGRESGRLTSLVQDIIDLSRLQAAASVREPVPVDVDAVVAEAVDRSRLTAEAREVSIDVGPATGATVYGDHDLLVTAVRNLVDNAIRYSEPGTRVGIGVRHQHGLVEVAVADQGIGIPEGELDRVFERFYRIDPARSRATGGTGLGLSIVKHVAANHGGDVTVWSRPGHGSTFTLRLPDAATGAPGGRPDPPSHETGRADRPARARQGV